MKKGFTLIELLVVVLIVGILAAVALPHYRVSVMRARAVQLMAVVDKMWEAQQVYYIANGVYTHDAQALDIQWPAGSTSQWETGLTYPFGSCQMYSGKLNEVWCSTRDGELMFLRPFSNRTAQCRSYNGSKTAEQVCKSLGGQYYGTNSSYTTYLLQEK